LAFIGIRGFDGSISDESSLASVLCTIGVIFLILSFWLHENFILVWYYTKFMVHNICSLFRKHAKIGVVETLEQPASPHGAQATRSLHVTTGGPIPPLLEGLFSIDKKKKVQGETSAKLNTIRNIGQIDTKFPRPMSGI
jgi:hypothetical protein